MGSKIVKKFDVPKPKEKTQMAGFLLQNLSL
jgi:hypothetical protein